MDSIITVIDNVSSLIWGGTWDGKPVLPFLPVGILAVLLLGTGVVFMLRLGFLPLRRFFPALAEAWAGRKASGEGAITPWQALSTALSGQVGTGNLAGVATAITLGGPGAIFWMWVTAILGMACAFAESSLAVKYREDDHDTKLRGGPMYYIKHGLNKGREGFGGPWGWLIFLFCIGTLISAFATGGMIQSNSIGQTIVETGKHVGVSVPLWAVGAVVATLTYLVIIGGIKSIGSFAGKIVPLMAFAYVVTAAVVLVMHAQHVPEAFRLIFASAFGLEQAFGGAAGYGVMSAVRYGIARGLFSNEAGQGSAPIAHATAKTAHPAMQGEIAMIGVFIDTIIICTMTALVLLTVTGDFKRSPARVAAEMCMAQNVALPNGFSEDDLFPTAYSENRAETISKNGSTARNYLETCAANGQGIEEAAFAAATDPSVLSEVRFVFQTDAEASGATTRAYATALPGGEWIITIALFLFAFTTILGWSYYAETAVTYIFGEKAAMPMRYVWVGMIFLGCLWTDTDSLWRMGDIANASMAFPNLIALLLLSGTVVTIAKEYETFRKNKGK